MFDRRIDTLTIRALQIAILFIAIAGVPIPDCRAGYGRQSMIVEADYDEAAVCQWIEKNANAIQESTRAKIVATHGAIVTLQIETKDGTQVFRIRRTGRRGDYRGVFVDRSSGSLSDYEYRIQVTPLEGGRSQVEITMAASSEEFNGIAINVELRKSLRSMRTFLESKLTKESSGQ